MRMTSMHRGSRSFGITVCLLAVVVFTIHQLLTCSDDDDVDDEEQLADRSQPLKPPPPSPLSSSLYYPSPSWHVYNHSTPVVFLVGLPRSGTSLLRAMLDSLEQVDCTSEVYVLSQMLGMQMRWQNAGRESKMLAEGGVSRRVLAAAVSAFALEVMSRGRLQPGYLCSKLAYALTWSEYIVEMFPRVRFLFVVRDGRAFAHSVISKRLRITGFMARNVTQALRQWNRIVRLLDRDCRRLGPARCQYVQYERLVLDSEGTMRSVLEFLQLPWNDWVLHPERNRAGSAQDDVGPIRNDSVTAWYSGVSTAVPDSLKYNASSIAPMLTLLGYDVTHFPPRYVTR